MTTSGCRSALSLTRYQLVADINPTVHVPVLLSEVIEQSNLSAGKIAVDGTLGAGGHAVHFYRLVTPGGQVVGIDRDPFAVANTKARLAEMGIPNDTAQLHLVSHSYRELPQTLSQLNITGVDCILLDLGLSSDQLAQRDRGFSFRTGGPLDLRYNPDDGYSAADLLSFTPEEELANMIYQYGEERFSRRIAKAIVARRHSSPIETAEQLHELIHHCVPGKTHGRVDASTRTFQALRIAVNEELKHLEDALASLPEYLNIGGRMIVISFHSLEDRMVKNSFRDHPLLHRLTKKPIIASQDELARNPRSRSAKLRVAQRI